MTGGIFMRLAYYRRIHRFPALRLEDIEVTEVLQATGTADQDWQEVDATDEESVWDSLDVETLCEATLVADAIVCYKAICRHFALPYPRLELSDFTMDKYDPYDIDAHLLLFEAILL